MDGCYYYVFSLWRNKYDDDYDDDDDDDDGGGQHYQHLNDP